MRTKFTPQNTEESQIANQAVNEQLHHFIVMYKGFSQNRFVNFLNTRNICNSNGDKMIVEDVRGVSGKSLLHAGNCPEQIKLECMYLVVSYKDVEELRYYPFTSSTVRNWFTDYLNTITSVIWKE